MALAFALWSGAALAQDVPLGDPLVVLDESFALWKGGDMAGYEAYIGAALRRAREEDALPPEWAFLFGTYSDYVRNEHRNSPYALRLAEEGLAYLAPNVLKRLVFKREVTAVTVMQLSECAGLPWQEQADVVFGTTMN